ncbi:spore coat U domain-containing protein [Achromobacter sp. AONIH1]|uniref:Csu type fimbrial protein n=1 Tax=Achromobacter sp. AONIH1 TaxID=1758194 RepID=UPI000CD1AAC4|nr:spore coat U domain-containing protein [Achromobacter sp. AONIH1]AUT45653.1 spore coat protein U [Achromobacter sp. AONIH1]
MERLIYRKTAFLLFTSLASASSLAAGQNSANFNVTIVIQANCTIAANNLTFPPQGVLSSAVTATSALTVTCTNTTPYFVGLSAGSGTGNTETNRRMFGAVNTSAFVAYQLYKSDQSVWGDIASPNTRQGGTGNGAAQTLTVNGTVPAQATPAPDTYSSTVTATVYF